VSKALLNRNNRRQDRRIELALFSTSLKRLFLPLEFVIVEKLSLLVYFGVRISFVGFRF